MVSFHYETLLRLHVSGVNKAVLSLASWQPLPAKDVLSGKHGKAGRIPVEEHVQNFFLKANRTGLKIDKRVPFLVFSVRNVLANLRCGAWVRGKTKGFISVAEEMEVGSARPYHVLACRQNELELTEFDLMNESLDEYEWMFSGVPVLWDEEDRRQIFERILTEAADHSHVFHLPRGDHPGATRESRMKWEKLHEVFSSTLTQTRQEAFKKLKAAATGLDRERNYLHHLIGTDSQGDLHVLIGIGELEHLGQSLREAGCRRALMVDNGGSTSALFYPYGVTGEPIQLVAAPNHRRPGTAYLLVFLHSNKFELFSKV